MSVVYEEEEAMKKIKWLTVFLFLLVLVSGISMTAYGEDAAPSTDDWSNYAAESFEGGSGTKDNPYLIGTPEQLAKLAKDVNEGTSYTGEYFKLTADLDLSAHVWMPIGLHRRIYAEVEFNKPFEGNFNGSGKKISGMIVDQRGENDRYSGGLFGCIRNTGAEECGIKDLTITDGKIYNNSDGKVVDMHNGILAGDVRTKNGYYVDFEGIKISGGSIQVSGSGGKTDNRAAGGMVGYVINVRASDCSVENIQISGVDNSGGFVGWNYGSVYRNCTAVGELSGHWSLGGFVGYAGSFTDDNNKEFEPVFEHCLADVDITADNWSAGGFVGYAQYVHISNCVAKGNVTSTMSDGDPRAGAFIGVIGGCTIEKSHAAGRVTEAAPDYAAGGFVAYLLDSGNKFKDCSFDSMLNNDIKAIGGKEPKDYDGIIGVTTQAVKGNICRDYDGNHNLKEVTGKDATCTEDGMETYWICDTCGTMYSDAESQNAIDAPVVIKATGHELVPTAEKSATCTEEGYKAYWTCKKCGLLFADENGAEQLQEPVVLPAAGHKFGDWKTVRKATEKQKGEKKRVCEVCQYEETEIIPKLENNKDSKPVKSNAEVAAVKTGDESDLLIYILAFGISMAGIAGVTLQKRKMNR